MKRFVAALMMLSGLLVAGGVRSAPITFTYRADNAAGSVNAVNFGPGATIVITLVGDTSTEAACLSRYGGIGTCILATSGTFSRDAGATNSPITNLNGFAICANIPYFGSLYTGPCIPGATDGPYSLGTTAAAVDLQVSSGPYVYPAFSIHTHPFFNPATFFNVAGGPVVLTNPEQNNTTASNVFWTVGTSPAPSAVPTLSEWAQLMLGLMVMTMVGWHFHRERSY